MATLYTTKPLCPTVEQLAITKPLARSLVPILATAVQWAATQDQPDNAIIDQFGLRLKDHSNPAPFLHISVSENGGLVMFIIERDQIRTPYESGMGSSLDNPYTAAEIGLLRWAVRQAGEFYNMWNGIDTYTVSIRTNTAAGPGYLASYSRYRDGCPQHNTVFCYSNEKRCTWLPNGITATIKPAGWI